MISFAKSVKSLTKRLSNFEMQKCGLTVLEVNIKKTNCMKLVSVLKKSGIRSNFLNFYKWKPNFYFQGLPPGVAQALQTNTGVTLPEELAHGHSLGK